MDGQGEREKREHAARWEKRKRQWRAEFGGWLGWIAGFWDGLNPSLSEEGQLESLLEEIDYMAKPMRERLAELQAAKGAREVSHGSGQ
jgi:hypothetical protein